jgi:hypothetical protein
LLSKNDRGSVAASFSMAIHRALREETVPIPRVGLSVIEQRRRKLQHKSNAQKKHPRAESDLMHPIHPLVSSAHFRLRTIHSAHKPSAIFRDHQRDRRTKHQQQSPKEIYA